MNRVLLIALLFAGVAAAQNENVVLVTADGLRWQDLFRGMDPELAFREDAGMKDADDLRRRLGGKTAEERRKKLMPFLWTTVAEQGVFLGNRDKGSKVYVRNRHRFSYPGYSEILVGRPQDDAIDSNDLRPNPSPTVLQIARRELDLERNDVALFASWHVFSGIGSSRADEVLINAGRAGVDLPAASSRLDDLNRAQFDALTPFGLVRHDYFTFELALETMQLLRPRLLYIALDETDDWAHNGRYDRTLEMIAYLDRGLERLWKAFQADPFYRGKTTLIVTTDHGRGDTPADWGKHGAKVDGAEAIWIAALGPHVEPLGETGEDAPVHTQSDIAPTILRLLGVEPEKLGPGVGEPIELITGR